MRKRSLRSQVLGGKILLFIWIIWFLSVFFVSIHLHNLLIDTIFYHLQCEYNPRNYWARSTFRGKNDQIWVFPQYGCYWGNFKWRYHPFEHILVFVWEMRKVYKRCSLMTSYFGIKECKYWVQIPCQKSQLKYEKF